MQNTDVPLAFCESIYNKYKNAGTSISPPPVEKNPLTNPAINPINDNFVYFFNCIFFVFNIKKPTFLFK